MTAAALRYKINPAIDAIQAASVLVIFVEDDVVVWRQADPVSLFRRVLRMFETPQKLSDVARVDPEIYEHLETLVDHRIVIPSSRASVAVLKAGDLANAFAHLLGVVPTDEPDTTASIVACLSEDLGIGIQQDALSLLAPHQRLLTCFRKGTTVFVPPLLGPDEPDAVRRAVLRFLATEVPSGNLALGHYLLHPHVQEESLSRLPPPISNWIASALIVQVTMSTLLRSATVYRGSTLTREEIPWKFDAAEHPDPPRPLSADDLMCRLKGIGNIVADVTVGLPSRFPTDLVMSCATMARPRFYPVSEREQLSAWGTGDSESDASVAAIMEAVERYCCGSYSLNDLPLRAASELTAPALDPDVISGYGRNDERIFTPHESSHRRRWHSVRRLRDNVEFFVPLELVRFPVDESEIGYAPCGSATSSGCAAHHDRLEAINRACHELVERDAFMIAWLRGAMPPRIELQSLQASLRLKIERLESAGYDVHLVDLSTEFAPVVLSVIVCRKPGCHKYSLGAASHDDPVVACRKALNEAELSLHVASKPPRSPDLVLQNLVMPTDHLEIFATGAHDAYLSPLFSSPVLIPLEHLGRRYDQPLAERLVARRQDVYVAELTCPEIVERGVHCHVVKAFVPELVPIQFGPQWPRTASSRIWSVPEDAGWITTVSDWNELRRFPHPFP